MELFNSKQILPAISNSMKASKPKDIAGRAEAALAHKSGNDLESVANDFESLMIQKMLESMRKTVTKSNLFESFSSDMYESMLDEELSKEISKGPGIGLKKMMLKELTRIQNNADQHKQTLHNKPETLLTIDLAGDVK
tara:strand:- start:617 stop:1030 length:414 start_codon:yes stop_codon:yes gene_type:complete